MKASDIDIGVLRREDASKVGAVARRNFSEFNAIVYRRFLFSYQGLTATLLIDSFFYFVLQPQSNRLHLVILTFSFGLHAFYLYVRHFYLNANLLHPDLHKVWKYWTLPNSHLLVAKDLENGGRIIGTLGVRRLAGSLASVGELSRLRVEKGYESRGIANSLIDEAENFAQKDLKCETIVTLTYPGVFPQTHELYTSRSYSVWRKMKGGGYYPNLHWEEILLKKLL